MKAAKTLAKPINWQDFESLCKKIWGDKWKCDEIVKNGRSGQQQHGVDVYGIPKGEASYYGIQCKGKDEYVHKQFSEQEVLAEIGKAKSFDPPLKKLYFATTAVKDAKIEAFIRKLNVQHINEGLFEVHLFAWEDIVDLINENKKLKYWYETGQDLTEKRVEITFDDHSTVLILKPKFRIPVTINRKKFPTETAFDMKAQGLFKALSFLQVRENPFAAQVNESYESFRIKIQNTGIEPLEEFKLLLEFKGKIFDLAKTNEIVNETFVIAGRMHIATTNINLEQMTGSYIPRATILVGDDSCYSERLYIKPYHEDSDFKIHWKIISKDLKEEGVLTVQLRPEIKRVYTTNYIEEDHVEWEDVGAIEDYIVKREAK